MEKLFIFRENWVIRVGKEEELNNFSEHWTMVQKDISWNIILVDNDSTKIAPIAKAILNEFELFPELSEIRSLKFQLKIVCSVLFVFLIFIFFKIPKISEIKTLLWELKPQVQQVQQVQQLRQEVPQQPIQRVIPELPQSKSFQP